MVQEFFQSIQGTILLLVLIIWQLPWKGVALWKAAQRKEVFWFIIIFLVNTIAILEIFYIYYVARDKKRWIEKKLKKRKVKLKNKK